MTNWYQISSVTVNPQTFLKTRFYPWWKRCSVMIAECAILGLSLIHI